MRWSEEVELLSEEMCCVLAFLLWEADWWKGKAFGRELLMISVELEGAIAYAERQAAFRIELCEHFKHLWHFIPHYIALGCGEVLEEGGEVGAWEDNDD
jgi:hypothetical protein